MLAFCTKAFPQYEHSNCLSAVWIFSCLFFPPIVENFLPHNLHGNPTKPSWVFTCAGRFRFRINLWQISHSTFSKKKKIFKINEFIISFKSNFNVHFLFNCLNNNKECTSVSRCLAFSCCTKVALEIYLAPQYPQINGNSPVCFLWWICSSFGS